ncbi:MAG TPA: hypothetical protein VNQ90_17685 [Chthoniobacteraceae bacterium]|nr:hypothetical protein [Chthoniobacteraceae bacterium]
MARIPLRDIPNAPQPVAGPSGRGGNRVNLGGAMSLLQRPTISPEAFSGPAKGLDALARGVGSIAGASEKAMKAALHLQDLVDDDKVFKAKMAFRDSASAGRQEIEARPEDFTQYGEIIKRHMEEGYQGFLKDNQDLSARARQRIEQEYLATSGDLYGRAQEMAVRKVTANKRAGVLWEAEQLASVGDGEGAAMMMEEEHGKGRFDDLEIEMKQKGFRNQAAGVRMDQMRLDRPDLALEAVRDEKKTPEFSPQERLQQERASRVAIAAKDGELMKQVAVMIDKGEVKSLEDVRKRLGEYGVGFSDRNLNHLKRELAPRAFTDTGAAKAILRKYRSMEIPADEVDRTEMRTALKSELRAVLLTDDRPEWMKLADKHFDGPPRKASEKRIENMNKGILDGGGFDGGYDKKKADEGDLTEVRKRYETEVKMDQVNEHMAQWERDHPKASTAEKGEEYQSYIEANGWMPPAKDERWWWQRWFGPSPDGEASEMRRTFEQHHPPAANPYKEGGQEWKARPNDPKPSPAPAPARAPKPSAAPTPAPEGSKQTSFGYPGDPYKDSNSLAGIGAWVSPEEQRRIKAGLPSEQKMRTDDFAASPDIEKALRAMGIKPGDMVAVQWSDGETTEGRWMDKTSKELRGRIDLYSPDGPHPKDGRKAVSWNKV